MPSSLLADSLRAGDRVLIGQATAEPVGLVAELFGLASRIPGIEVFCGLSLNPAWAQPVPDELGVTTYLGLGTVGNQVANGRARVLPSSLSMLSSLLASRRLPVDVVLLQVSPADAEGYHSLGCNLDYVWDAVQVARSVVVEVNPNVPVTRGIGRLHRSRVVVARQSDARLLESPAEAPNEVQRQVAKHVARLVPDGAAIQLGIGGLAVAVAAALGEKRGLKVRSGMIGDWFLDLVESGAIDHVTPDACLTSVTVGTQRLYESLSRDGLLGFALPSQLALPVPGAPLIAINSGIEVDLRGHVNAEFVGDRYVGAVGGQTDYFRAARAAGGLAILALPSTTARGASRIVQRTTWTTATQSDVDFIVTEHGAADLRATTLQERIASIASIADPRHRGTLIR